MLFKTTYYGNTVEQWLFVLVLILIVAIGGKVLYWLFSTVIKKLTKKTKTKIDDIIIDMIEEPIIFAVSITGIWFAIKFLNMGEKISSVAGNIFQALIILNLAWLFVRTFDALFEEYVKPLIDKSENDLDDQIMPIVRKGVKFIIWTVAILVALNNAGYNITALLAGLGIGGIAIAMAAKDTLSNILGGITILVDKPFMIDDRVKVNGYDGFVTEIGLRSTRLKTLEGRVITIPNSKFAEGAIENVTVEPSRKVVLNLGLVYDTTPKQMDKAMKILKDIAKKNKKVEEKVLLSFNQFGDSAMNILFIYYIKKGANILETQTEMSMEILKQFNKNKLDFAYPTQTIFTKK